MHIIKYNKPAKNWREALPLGNGLTGIMIYGSLKKERLCFNDGTLWSGYPKDYNSKVSLDNLEKIRKLISYADEHMNNNVKIDYFAANVYSKIAVPPNSNSLN